MSGGKNNRSKKGKQGVNPNSIGKVAVPLENRLATGTTLAVNNQQQGNPTQNDESATSQVSASDVLGPVLASAAPAARACPVQHPDSAEPARPEQRPDSSVPDYYGYGESDETFYIKEEIDEGQTFTQMNGNVNSELIEVEGSRSDLAGQFDEEYVPDKNLERRDTNASEIATVVPLDGQLLDGEICESEAIEEGDGYDFYGPGLKDLYRTILKCQGGLTGGANGDPIYGNFTFQSMADVLAAMRKHCELRREDTYFLDIGSGMGLPVQHAAQFVKMSIGIESVQLRVEVKI